ncbi:MAG: ATP-grasp domain-containing protein [Mycoplasma sp.]
MKKILLIEEDVSKSFIELCSYVAEGIKRTKKFDLTIVNQKDVKEWTLKNRDEIGDFDCVLMYKEDAELRRICDKMNVLVIPNTKFYSNSIDKWTQYELLSKNSLPTPYTVRLDSFDLNQDYDILFEEINKLFKNKKIVIKKSGSFGGFDVMLITTKEDFINACKKYENDFKYMILQEFIPEAKGFDYRVLVIGNKPIITIRRQQTNSDDFRSNVCQGGEVIFMQPIEEIDILCEKISKIFNADIAGVDILVGKDKYYVCEVNITPGISYPNADEIADIVANYIVGLLDDK